MARKNWKKIGHENRTWKYGTETFVLPKKKKRAGSSDAPWKDEMCGICGEGSAVPRSGPYGPFLSCTKFPYCTGNRSLARDGSMLGAWKGIFNPEVPAYQPRRRVLSVANSTTAVQAWYATVRG
jgi:hypothetical protein